VLARWGVAFGPLAVWLVSMKLLNRAFTLAFFALAPLVGFSADNEATKAFKEDLKKAGAGDPEAQCAIGSIYAGGNTSLGIKADRNIANSWYLKAANQGYKPVYGKLSMFHALEAVMCKARGASESEEIAEHIKWFLVSQNKEKHRNREWAFGQMSESTKAEGERRAKAFMDEQAKKTPAPSSK
jgi:TPR repeat protein